MSSASKHNRETNLAGAQSHRIKLRFRSETPAMPHYSCLCEAVSCIAGLLIAYVSDTTLHEYVVAKKHNGTAGKPQQQLLQTGTSAQEC